MIVCQCRGITDRDIREAVRQGALERGQVARASEAGRDCGGCRPLVDEIISKLDLARPGDRKQGDR